MEDLAQKANSYTLDNLPEDVELFTKQTTQYDPIDPSETYTVQIMKAELVDNRYYKPDETDPMLRGQKYQLSLEYRILDEGEFYGRKLWDYANLVFKPEGKRGASKLYKVVTSAMKAEFSWDECASFASSIQVFMKNIGVEVLNKQVKVGIENVSKPNGNVRTKIISYNRVKKELPAFNPEKVGVGAEKVDSDKIPF